MWAAIGRNSLRINSETGLSLLPIKRAGHTSFQKAPIKKITDNVFENKLIVLFLSIASLKKL